MHGPGLMVHPKVTIQENRTKIKSQQIRLSLLYTNQPSLTQPLYTLINYTHSLSLPLHARIANCMIVSESIYNRQGMGRAYTRTVQHHKLRKNQNTQKHTSYLQYSYYTYMYVNIQINQIS